MFEELRPEAPQMLRACITASTVLILLGGHAIGQSFMPLPHFPPAQVDLAKRHMDPLGKPCLMIEGYAKPELSNKNIYEHIVKATNNCGQNINVQACYYKTQNCVVMSVPPWQSKTSILGFFPALKRFQFEAKEQ
jgi:hypothetical protein